MGGNVEGKKTEFLEQKVDITVVWEAIILLHTKTQYV